MKKRLFTILIASLTASVLFGCSSTDFANMENSGNASLGLSDENGKDNSNDAESLDDAASEESLATIDDESTALISSMEYSFAAMDLFDELMADPGTEELDDDQVETLKNGASDCSGVNFIGTWNRTFVAMGMDADITIEEGEDSTCVVNGYFDHYGNMGDIEDATGYFLSENMMFAIDEECDTVYLFRVTGESMEVRQKGFGCMGGNVSSIGTYVMGEPEYLNAHDIDFAFTEEELSAIKELLDEYGLDYEEYFETAILYGYFTTEEGEAMFDDGTVVTGRWYTAVAPHGCTRNLEMFIAFDGTIYMKSGFNPMAETEYYTSDPKAQAMPEKVEEAE